MNMFLMFLKVLRIFRSRFLSVSYHVLVEVCLHSSSLNMSFDSMSLNRNGTKSLEFFSATAGTFDRSVSTWALI